MLSWTRAERPEGRLQPRRCFPRHRPHWMEMKTRLPFLLLSALLLVALLAACGGGGNSGPVPADAVAQVDGTPVSKTSFTALMDVACARYKAQGQACPKGGTPTYPSLRDPGGTFLSQ